MTCLHRPLLVAAVVCLAVACAAPDAAAPRLPVADLKTEGVPEEFASVHLDGTLLLYPGVFPPHEAEQLVLPFMGDHRALFEGKRVFEIGTGSGIISLYAAQLGAARVVCSDISPNAIASVRANAVRLGFDDVIDARLVPADDIGAFSVVADDEVFDVVISNPPYALDLDADYNTALVDKGDLGLSIVDGLAAHLAPDGVAALFYGTLFYHHVIVKYARWRGYEVRTHVPLGLTPWAMEALFNLYLRRLLEREGLPTDAFRFYKEELPYAASVVKGPQPPLLGDGETADKVYSGFLTIRRGR